MLVTTSDRWHRNCWVILCRMGLTGNNKKRVLSQSSEPKDGKAAQSAVQNGHSVNRGRSSADPEKTDKVAIKTALKAARKGKFDLALKPMLATLVDKAFDEPGWLYEVKWDGYRALAFLQQSDVILLSRNQKSFNDKFYPVVETLKQQKLSAILDGEIIVANEEGISDFGALQNWRSESDGDLRFCIFDILWLDGKDLRDLPLNVRRQILKKTLKENETVRYSENFGDSAVRFMDVARQMGLEGIIAKRADSGYQAGVRSKDWLKIKADKRQEVIIGGYTRNENSSKIFSSLLVGVQQKGKLIYTGKVGTGFDARTQKDLLKKFNKLISRKVPFTETPDVNKPSRFRPNPPAATATWLKPKLVCEVKYTELTSDGIMRHPSFVGLRSDKNVSEISLEKAVSTKKVVSANKTLFKKTGISERKSLLNPKEETQVKKVNSHPIKFTNLSKVFWPEEKYTKRDLINYYYQVAPFMLPYLKDRPQSLNRFPNGIKGKSFYQKDVTGKAPGWIKTHLYHSEADKRDKNFLVCTNEASLLYMASLGCIEINPWSSTIKNPDHPDWCIIDLDPADNTFNQVIEAAQVTKSVLDSLGVVSCCKTSGSTGLHIYIPFGAKYTYEQSKEFARVVATMVHRELPAFTSIERMVKNRKGKMYVDFLQNRPQATVAAPYSVRPKPGATVSMPLYWDEVKKGLKMKDFTIKNAMARLKETGDLFAPVLGNPVNLNKVIKQL